MEDDLVGVGSVVRSVQRAGARMSRLILSLLLLAATGCIVGPQPDPPSVRAERLSFPAERTLEGAPGAVAIEATTAWALAFDSTNMDGLRGPVAADGSFGPLDLVEIPNDAVLVQVLAADGWRDPIAVRREATRAVAITDDYASCLIHEAYVEPVGEVTLSTPFTVTFTNDCDQELTVTALALAVDDGQVIGTSGSLILQRDGEATFGMELTPVVDGEYEEIARFVVEDGAAARFERYTVIRAQGI